ncbi:MAG: hypothetical protein IIA14_03545 [SAR324 cluster bacterium]|nr:hypothetical protein [SAR324 cluster bacterium]
MATDVEIVIRAVDRFGAVFDDLGKAFGRVGQSGTEAQASVAGLAQGVGGLAAAAETAGQAMDALATENAEKFLVTMADPLWAEIIATQEALAGQFDEVANAGERAESAARNLSATMSDPMYALAIAGNEAMVKTQKAQIEETNKQGEAMQLLTDQAGAMAQSFGGFAALMATQGRGQFNFFKTLAIAEATAASYTAFTKALASGLGPPWTFFMAAGALARGLAAVRRIQQLQPPQAHGGLDFVPQEQTFLLNRGERVLAPDQNRDLMDFLRRQTVPGGSDAAPQINITIQGGADERAVERLMRRLEEQVALRRLRLAN